MPSPGRSPGIIYRTACRASPTASRSARFISWARAPSPWSSPGRQSLPMPAGWRAPTPYMRCAMNRCLILTLPLLASLLAGCSTPVPQSLPPQMQPPAFTGPIADKAPAWPEADWWKGFHDDELAGLIAEAQVGNRDLAVAAAHVMEAEAQSTIARAALFPQVNGQANHVNAGCSGQACNNFANEKSFGLTFNASYELDVWGLAQDNLRAANEQLKSTRFTRQAVALALNANVADQY